jgi:predicted transcriptional regulator
MMGYGVMVKKSISIEIPESLVISLDKLAKRTGRKKTLIMGASLSDFLEASENKQEETIKKYLNMQKE